MSADPITGEKGEMAAEQIIRISVSSGPTVPLKKKIERERKRMCAVEAIKDAFVPHSSPCHLRMHADIAWQGWG